MRYRQEVDSKPGGRWSNLSSWTTRTCQNVASRSEKPRNSTKRLSTFQAAAASSAQQACTLWIQKPNS